MFNLMLSFFIFLVGNNVYEGQSLIRKDALVIKFSDDFRSYSDKESYPAYKKIKYEYSFEIKELFPGADKRGKAKEFDLDLYYVVKFDSDKYDVYSLKKQLENLEGIQKVEFDYRKVFYYYPNDPSFTNQWALFKMEVPDAWDLNRGADTILIHIDDTGVDWDHEDLVGNMWQNLGEDVDGDGRVIEWNGSQWVFDPGDINGIDDDGNGYADDFVGWDFYENDNDPSPVQGQAPDYEHGTHVAGIASATTDNGIGVAGVGFNCAIIGARTYWVTNSASSLYYATNIGVDVVNMSWGCGFSLPTYLKSALDYAYANNVVLVAAAGNESTSSYLYPAAYYKVIAVAATDEYDNHSSYTNFGSWVDIAAPGDAILSTIPDNGYDAYYGTSMASPNTAGVCALIRAMKPGLPNDSVRWILLHTADSIPFGVGDTFIGDTLKNRRVNAYKALRWIGVRNYSYLVITDYYFDDSSGDDDGRPDPGEEVGLVMTLFDSLGWQNANNVTVKIRSLSSYIEVTDSVAYLGSISNGSSATISSGDLVFNVSSGITEPFKGKLEIEIISNPPSVNTIDTIEFIVGQPYVLLVDDDGGDDYETYYTKALDTLGVLYDYWDVNLNGVPSLYGIYGLLEHDVIIWFTGSQSSTLSDEEQDSLMVALDNGINLFISSQNLGEDIGSSNFYQNYIKASFVSGNANAMMCYGYSGDPISDGDTLVIFGSGGANNSNSEDLIEPYGGSVACYSYDVDGNNVAAIRYAGSTYKLVYFAFPFEAINDQVAFSTPRHIVLYKILDWLDVPVVGIGEKRKERKSAVYMFNVYPTVFKEKFVLSVKDNNPGYVEIYDIKGSLVKKIKTRKGLNVIKLNSVSTGVYYLKYKKTVRKVLKVK